MTREFETTIMSAYKAFVSSTYDDLKEHRAYVIPELRIAGIQVDS